MARKPKAAEQPQAPVQYLHLLAESQTAVTRDRDPGDRWSGEDTSRSWTVTGIALSDKDGCDALPADFPVALGDTVYAVYAVYSTGDSFSRNKGANLEVVAFYKTAEKAHTAAAAISKRKRDREQDFKMSVELGSGGVVKLYCQWDGYFESLDYVRVESFAVGGERGNRYYPDSR